MPEDRVEPRSTICPVESGRVSYIYPNSEVSENSAYTLVLRELSSTFLVLFPTNRQNCINFLDMASPRLKYCSTPIFQRFEQISLTTVIKQKGFGSGPVGSARVRSVGLGWVWLVGLSGVVSGRVWSSWVWSGRVGEPSHRANLPNVIAD